MVTSCPPVIIKAAGPNAPVSTDIQARTQTNTHTGRARRCAPLCTLTRGLVLQEVSGQRPSVGGTAASCLGLDCAPRFSGKVGVGRHWEGLPEMGVWVRIKICSVFLSSKKIWGN